MIRSRRQSWLPAWLLWLVAAQAFASGPRFVTGPPFFPGTQSLPIGWKQANLLYSTDPGNLSAAVPHAAADALVAAAAGVWNLPVASITLSRGQPLAEHVSGANVYLDTSGMVYPADVMSSNAAAVPIAVIYDTNGSVTDTLLGSGASGPASCNSNAVTSTVDSFDPAGYILHAIIVLNGRCTGPAAAQQQQMQYKLERAFGRVLGLAWSQTNDNVFTGSPTPTYNQALHWPIMHPIDILCGQYSYQCLPNPFTLRPDDVASMVTVYPIAANAAVTGVKQPSLAAAVGAYGTISFPNGQGMAGVNVQVKRHEVNLPQDPWDEVSSVTGSQFRRADASPFVTAGTSAPASMGTVSQRYAGFYTMAYIPLDAGKTFADLTVFTEPVNPLYTGSYGLGPYGLNAVAPSGSPPVPLTFQGVPAPLLALFNFPIADAASACGTGLDGTAADPAQVAVSGWWNATLCGYGHASYFGADVKPGRTFTLEATALDAGGLATTTKAMPVIGLFAPTDGPGSLPSLGVAASAFQGLAHGTTVLAGSTGQLSRITIGIADERGDGRPDYLYQGRLFYADNVEPAQVPASGGTITVTGMGFRTGNALLVNGVAATVTRWSANAIVATVPTSSAAHATQGAAVDLELLDRGTGATSTIAGGLTYSGAASLPNAMLLLSAPAGTLPVGLAATVPLAVRVVAQDGVTPVAGATIVFSATRGSVSFGCGGSVCKVVTDANGNASTTVMPLGAGTITLQAADGTLLEQASFTAQNQPQSMAVLLAPKGSFPVGTSILTPFVVRVYGPDGVTGLPNQRITFTVAGGSAVYTECNTPVCTATTDITGAYSIFVTPTGPGNVTLQASDGSLSQQATFLATQDVDTMVIASAPNPNAFVGESDGSFSVQLLRGDGVTGDYGELVSFSVAPGAVLSGCPNGTCQLYTGSSGMVGASVSANVPGTFTVQATYGSLSKTVSFTAVARTLSLKILSVPSGQVPVGTAAATPFTVQLIGLDGVTPLPGYLISLGGPEGQEVLGACHDGTCGVATDANGIVSTTVTPLVAGTIPISAAYTPLVVATSVFGVAPTNSLDVVTQPGGTTVYPGDAVPLRVRLLRPDGATPDAGQTVTYTVTNGALALSSCGTAACPVVTDAQGNASITGVAGGAGPVSVTASYGSLHVTIDFVISPRPHVLGVISAPASGAYVGAAAAQAFAIRVFAADGVTPVAGEPVVLSIASGSAAFAACGGLAGCTLVADATGLVTTPVTPLGTGPIVLDAADGNVTVSATFTATSPPDVLKLVSAPASGSYVGVVAGTSFSVQVLLGSGSPAPAGKNVTVTVTQGAAAFAACGGASACGLVTDAHGLVATLVTPGAAGTITLAATDGSTSLSASFTAAVRPDVLQVVSAPANGSLVGDVAATPLVVRVLAGDGIAPVKGRSITLSVTAGSASFAACGSPACTLTTDASGLVSSAVTPLTSGAVTVLAADGSVTQTATFTAASKPDTLHLLSAPASGAFAGIVAASPFSVQVFNGDGITPAAGRSVTLTVTNGTATFGACSGSTICVMTADAQGIVSSSVTPLAPGSITLAAADGAVIQTATFIAVARPDLLVLVSGPANGSLAGDPASIPFAVRVLAGDGTTPLAGHAIVVSVLAGSASFGACSAAPCTLLSDLSGLVSTAVIPLLGGAITLQAADGGVVKTTSFTAASKPDLLTITSVPANGAWTGTAAILPFSVRLTKADGITASVGVAIGLSASGGASLGACGAATCSLVTDANGVVSTPVTPLVAGTVGLQAADGALIQTASFTSSSRPDTLAVESVPADGSVAGRTAAVPFAVQVLAGDSSKAAGRTVTVTVTNGVLAACNAATCSLVSDAQGIVSTAVTPLRAGSVALSASEGTAVVSASFLAIAGPDVLSVVSVPANGTLAGDQAALPFGVEVLAYDGTPAAGRSVTVSITNGRLAACAVAVSCVLTADASGLVSTGVTPLNAGTVSLLASDGSLTASAAFTAGARPDRMVLVSAPAGTGSVGDAMPVAFAAQVIGGDGTTPAAGRNVAFTVVAGQASFGGCAGSVCTLATDANGLASTPVTPLAPGTITIQATEAGNTLSASFAAAAKPDLLKIVANPGVSVHADALAATPFAVQVLLADGATPAAGVAVTFSIAGRGAGSVEFGACGGATCAVSTDAGGRASTTVTGIGAGALTLLATADPASGAGSVSWAFQVVANDDSLNALEAATYVAEGALVQATLEVSALANGAVAAGLPVAWKGSSGVLLGPVQAATDANGLAAAEVSLGPLAGGASASASACAWNTVCTAFEVLGVAQAQLQVAVASGAGQAVTGGAALKPVVVWVSDGAGHPVAGAAVTIYQTASALTLDCPPGGRCPAQPVLGSKVTVATSAADGTVSVSPLVVPGSATETSLAFATGSTGFATASVSSRP